MATAFDTTLARLGITRAGAAPEVKSAQSADALTTRDFIKLLTAQLRNQDPTSPTDAAQQLTQLAQFSQVSGLNDVNTTLKAIQGQLGSRGDAIGFAGRTVLVPGDTAYARASGGIAASVELAGDASDVRVAIQDANGAVVHTRSLGRQAKGTVSFDWDGITDSGAAAGDGPFKLIVSARSGNAAVAAQPLVWATVRSVAMPGSGAATLTLPGLGKVPVGDVREVG